MLERIDNPLVVPELALFNLELNGTPLRLEGGALSRLATELEHTLAQCNAAAAGLDACVTTVDILPTLRPEHLVPAQMTSRERYRALNQQILRLRNGEPIRLEIHGEQPLTIEQQDVMLEAAATSFQIHRKMSAAESARIFNASKIISAPMVALAANSPLLFGRELWCETRIPLFEQAVSVGDSPLRERVGFGIRDADRSVMECFRANIEAANHRRAKTDLKFPENFNVALMNRRAVYGTIDNPYWPVRDIFFLSPPQSPPMCCGACARCSAWSLSTALLTFMASSTLPWQRLWPALWGLLPNPTTVGRVMVALDDSLNTKAGRTTGNTNGREGASQGDGRALMRS